MYIFLFIIILVLIDITNYNHLWGENFHRRFTHHLQRNEYHPHKKPYINILNKFLDKDKITQINSLTLNKNNCLSNISSISSKLIGGNYSKKCTLYYDDFDNETKNIVDRLGNQIKPKLEKILGRKLYLGTSSFRCCILRYEGKDAEFTCHYDTEPHNCYRTLFLFKKKGKIPKFGYYNENHEYKTLDLELGDGIFFQGTKTYHCVEKSEDSDMSRYMIGWQYTTDPSIKDRSLCSELRSQKLINVISILLPYFITTIILSIIIKKNFKIDISYNKYLYIITIITILVSTKLPKYLPNKIGTRVNFSIIVSLKILLLCFFSTFNLNFALIFYNYIVITEMLLPNFLLNDSLKNTGF